MSLAIAVIISMVALSETTRGVRSVSVRTSLQWPQTRWLEIDAEPPDAHAPDRVLAGKEMPVRDLIEDQLILELPYAPRHEGCAAGAGQPADDRISPFAGLRGLMRGKH